VLSGRNRLAERQSHEVFVLGKDPGACHRLAFCWLGHGVVGGGIRVM
jgi:hypothetical protein